MNPLHIAGSKYDTNPSLTIDAAAGQVGLGVGVTVGVTVIVGVILGVTVGVTEGVGVTVGVTEGVTVGVTEGVIDGVTVGVTEGVGVIVGVTLGVGVGDGSNCSTVIQKLHSTDSIITSNGHDMLQFNNLNVSQLLLSTIFNITCGAPANIEGNVNVRVGDVVLPVPINVQLLRSVPHT